MQQIIPTSFLKLNAGRVLPIVAVAGVLALSLLIQPAHLLGIGASVTYTSACTSADISAAPASPSSPGASVTLTGQSTNCTSPEYKFWLLAPDSTTWVAQTGFSTTTTFVWNTTGDVPGVWQIGVWARQVGSTATYEAYAIRTYSLTISFCTSATITPSVASPQLAGVPVTFTATAAGCSSPLFEFWELPAGSSTWVVVRAFSAGNTFVWTTTGLPNGPYRFGIWANQTGSPNAHDTFAIMTFWIDP
jgi:hypothetical protein